MRLNTQKIIGHAEGSGTIAHDIGPVSHRMLPLASLFFVSTGKSFKLPFCLEESTLLPSGNFNVTDGEEFRPFFAGTPNNYRVFTPSVGRKTFSPSFGHRTSDRPLEA